MTPTVANVLAVYNAASADDLREGLSWYLDARNFARLLDPDNPPRAAGVIAALSPLNHWDVNKRQAEKVYQNGTALGMHTIPNEVKADRIFHGEDPLDVLGGDKVRAFYQAILNPWGFDEPVIDRHAFDIAIGRVTDNAAKSILGRKGVYSQFASVYVDAAKVAGISASQMQAVTWLAWRRMKGEGNV